MFVHAEQETPVSGREKETSTSPHMRNDMSPFLLFFPYSHCFREIKTERSLDLTESDFKTSSQSHMKDEEGKHAG